MLLPPHIGSGRSRPENKSANTLVVSTLCYSNAFSQSHVTENIDFAGSDLPKNIWLLSHETAIWAIYEVE